MNKLYAGGPEMRLRQEWILGVGGVRVLRAMGIDPAVWHANEGHAAFMMVERLREPDAGRRRSTRRSTRSAPAACSPPTRRCRRAMTPSPSSSSRPAPGRCGTRWASTATRSSGSARTRICPGQFHMTVTAMRLSGRRERRVAPARPGLPQHLARPLARPALGGGADRARHQRRAPRHLDGEPDHGPARRAPGRATGAAAWTSRASGTRC